MSASVDDDLDPALEGAWPSCWVLTWNYSPPDPGFKVVAVFGTERAAVVHVELIRRAEPHMSGEYKIAKVPLIVLGGKS